MSRRSDRDGGSGTGPEGREEPPPAILAGLNPGRRPRLGHGPGLGPGIGLRVAFQFRVVVHAGPRADHAAEPGSGPDPALVRALRLGGECPDREERDQPRGITGSPPARRSPRQAAPGILFPQAIPITGFSRTGCTFAIPSTFHPVLDESL